MVKTTLELKDNVYRKLVEASLEKYGNTKNISKTANELIEESLGESREKDIKKRMTIAKKTAGIWSTKESGSDYVRRIRSESDKRFKKLGI